MNIFRLQMMLDLLNEMQVAIPQFEITAIAEDYWNDEPVEVTRVISKFSLNDWTDALESSDPSEQKSCGYSACAVGHAMFDPRFNALGLVQHEGSPMYEGQLDWTAVQQFFGISYDTASLLFSPGSYFTGDDDNADATPADVAERVQVLLLHGEIELIDRYY